MRLSALAVVLLVMTPLAVAYGDEVPVKWETLAEDVAPIASGTGKARAAVTLEPAPGDVLPGELRAFEAVARVSPEVRDGAVVLEGAGARYVAVYVKNVIVQNRALYLAPGADAKLAFGLGGPRPALRARVLGEDGRPLRGAHVRIEAVELERPERGVLRYDAQGDDDGRFSVAWLPPSRVVVSVSQDRDTRRYASWTGTVPVEGRDVELRESTGAIGGTLFASDAGPLADVYVGFHPVRTPKDELSPWARCGFESGNSADGFASVAPHGRFFARVPSGPHGLGFFVGKGTPRWVPPGSPIDAPPGVATHVAPRALGLADLPKEEAHGTLKIAAAGFSGPWPVVAEVLGPGRVAVTTTVGDPSLMLPLVLPPGEYSIRLTQHGRETWLVEGVKVESGKTLRLRTIPPKR